MRRFWSGLWLGALAIIALAVVGVVVARPRSVLTEANQGLRTSRGISSTSGPSEWAMEGYNPARTRASSDNLPLPFSREREVNVSLDDGDGSPVTIARNLLLVEADHRLRAIDLRTGKTRWSYEETGQYLSPAVAGSYVYIRSEQNNEGQIIALDLRSGQPRWTFRPRRISSPETGYWGGHLTSPVVVEGIVLIGAGKELYALDARSGRQLWEYGVADYIFSSVTADEGRVYISDAGHVYAVEQATGRLIWKTPIALSVYFSPIVAKQTVFLTNGQKLLALNAGDGSQRWEIDYEGETLLPGAVQGSRVFAKSATTLFAFDVASGKELWRTAFANFVSLPVIAGEQLIAVTGATGQTSLTMLDVATGRPLWSKADPRLATAAPIVAGRTLYARTRDGSVLGFSQ